MTFPLWTQGGEGEENSSYEEESESSMSLEIDMLPNYKQTHHKHHTIKDQNHTKLMKIANEFRV